MFFRILLGIKACHEAKICNRDIKLENILLDETFNPKICDFGFSEIDKNEVTGKVGTLKFMAPEVYLKKSYNGYKADIFNLGIALLIFVTGDFGFTAHISDEKARLIYKKDYKKFWDTLKAKGEGISEEFKNLFFRMLNKDSNKRPSIDDVLNDIWFENIRKALKNKEELNILEDKLKKELSEREILVNDGYKLEIDKGNKDNNTLGELDKGSESDNFVFDLDLKPKYIDIESVTKNYIKIKDNINPAKFMSKLYNYIINEYKDICTPEKIEDKKKLKFYVEFENEIAQNLENYLEEEESNSLENDDKEEIENSEEYFVEKENLIIQIIMYETLDGDYLIKFVKKSGELFDFYDKLNKIFSFVKTM